MDKERIGYLKYQGESVKDGFMDARKQAEALLGFDEILRYFVTNEENNFGQINFEIPVRVQKGCIEFDLGELINLGLIIKTAITAYATQTAIVSAKDGFFESGLIKDSKKILKNSLIALQWIIKISKHAGSIANKKFKKIVPQEINNQNFVEITNENDEVLLVLKKHHDIFIKIPDKILSKNVKLINDNEKLIIGVFEGEKEEVAEIIQTDKVIFYDLNDDVDEEIILPDLKHGDIVADLEGKINKVIENKNKFSFTYNNHIIDCLLEEGARVGKFKNKIISEDSESIFATVKISGIVSREDKDGLLTAKKPKIILSNIKKIEGNKEINLFNLNKND
jgi:hypothetical protein